MRALFMRRVATQDIVGFFINKARIKKCPFFIRLVLLFFVCSCL